MKNSLNCFAFEDFFIRFSEGVTNIGLLGLPKDVHLSISHHPNSPDINLHVTRNFGPEKDKPKLVICTVGRDEIMNCLESGFNRLFELFFERVNPADLKHAQFISFDKLRWMERDAAVVVMRSAQQKKKKLRFNGDVVAGCTDMIKQPSVRWRLWQAIQDFPRHYAGLPQSGLLICSNACECILLTAAGCFRQKLEVPAESLMNVFVEQEILKQLHFKTLLAIRRVSSALDRHEIAGYNQPLRLSSKSSFSSSGS